MLRQYFDLSEMGNELLKMMDPEVRNTRLRDVIDFEVDYARRAFEMELKEKDEESFRREIVLLREEMELSRKEMRLLRKEIELYRKTQENYRLKRILEEHNIQY